MSRFTFGPVTNRSTLPSRRMLQDASPLDRSGSSARSRWARLTRRLFAADTRSKSGHSVPAASSRVTRRRTASKATRARTRSRRSAGSVTGCPERITSSGPSNEITMGTAGGAGTLPSRALAARVVAPPRWRSSRTRALPGSPSASNSAAPSGRPAPARATASSAAWWTWCAVRTMPMSSSVSGGSAGSTPARAATTVRASARWRSNTGGSGFSSMHGRISGDST